MTWWAWMIVGALLGSGLICLLTAAILTGAQEDKARAQLLGDQLRQKREEHERDCS